MSLWLPQQEAVSTAKNMSWDGLVWDHESKTLGWLQQTLDKPPALETQILSVHIHSIQNVQTK